MVSTRKNNRDYTSLDEWALQGAPRIAVIGECMIEISESSAGQIVQSYAGDSLNTAVYLARLSDEHSLNVDYVTALGNDPFSEEMLCQWKGEGIGVELVLQVSGKRPGLYWVKTNAEGERSFHYWRDNSAAKQMISKGLGLTLYESLIAHQIVYFTGISLAILDAESRAKLLTIISDLREAGAKIIFDTNYRAGLWASRDQAKSCISAFLKVVDVALVSFEDEQSLFQDLSKDLTALRLHACGVSEVVVKDGSQGCLVSTANHSEIVASVSDCQPVDTTAAGDSFNAAYIASRAGGHSIPYSAQKGHELASQVIKYHGAIMPTH